MRTSFNKLDGDVSGSHLQDVVHQVVMEFLGDPVERQKLSTAYDALIECCYLQQSVPIDHVSSCSTIPILCDLYRSLIIISFLLRLKYSHPPETCCCLEASVERSFWLLQILVAAPTASDLVRRLPLSSYPILNELLQEPLIPLSREERQEFWWSLSQHDDANKNNNEDVNNDAAHDEGFVLGIPDKKQLAAEERQLLRMARRPIPESTGERDKEMNALSYDRKDEQQSMLLPSDVLVEDEKCSLYRCGVLCFESRTYVLSSQTLFQADNNFITLEFDEKTCASVPISASKCVDWQTGLKEAIQQKHTLDMLQNQTLILWNLEDDTVNIAKPKMQ